MPVRFLSDKSVFVRIALEISVYLKSIFDYIESNQLKGELVDVDIKALLLDLLQLDSSKNFPLKLLI